MLYDQYAQLSDDDKLASADCGHALTAIRRAGGKVPSEAWKSIDSGDFDGYIAAVGTGTPERDFAVRLANHARANNLRVPRTKFGAKKRTPRTPQPGQTGQPTVSGLRMIDPVTGRLTAQRVA